MGLPVSPDSEFDEGVAAALRQQPPIAPGQQQRAWEAVRSRAAAQTPLPPLTAPNAPSTSQTEHVSLRDAAARLWRDLATWCFDDTVYTRARNQHRARRRCYTVHNYLAYSMFDVAA